MISTSDVDPELHQLRSVARALDGRDRSEVEGARFNLFASLERGDADAARRWARSVRMALLALGDDHEDRREMGLEAIAEIEGRLSD